jgi:hypothetical protein
MDSEYVKKRLDHFNILDQMEEQVEFVGSLTGEDKTAIEEYSSDAFYSINESMREHRNLSKADRQTVETLDKLFAAVPLTTTELIVYRGVKKTVDYTLTTNQTGYHSTSYDMAAAKCFLNHKSIPGSTLLTITLPVGSRILPIEGVSYNPGEHEILLPHWSTFTFLDNTDILACDTSNIKFYSEIPSIPNIKTKPILLDDFDEWTSVLTGGSSYVNITYV